MKREYNGEGGMYDIADHLAKMSFCCAHRIKKRYTLKQTHKRKNGCRYFRVV